MVMQQTSRPASMIPDDDLHDPILRSFREATYGREVIAHEISMRQRERRQVVDLRGDNVPPPDPWEGAKQQARTLGEAFDPVTTAGMRCGLTQVGDAFDVEFRRREQERARQIQRDRWVVSLGAHVTLRSGTTVGAGEPITEAQIEHPRALEILQALVGRGVVQAIDPHVAWLRGLDPSVGPYVVVKDFTLSTGKKFRRGQGCKEEDFPPLELPRQITDDMRAADLSVKELRRLIVSEIEQRVPRAPVPPQRSQFDLAISFGQIEAAPNWRPPTPKRGGK